MNRLARDQGNASKGVNGNNNEVAANQQKRCARETERERERVTGKAIAKCRSHVVKGIQIEDRLRHMVHNIGTVLSSYKWYTYITYLGASNIGKILEGFKCFSVFMVPSWTGILILNVNVNSVQNYSNSFYCLVSSFYRTKLSL